jgi:hypothetical protein
MGRAPATVLLAAEKESTPCVITIQKPSFRRICFFSLTSSRCAANGRDTPRQQKEPRHREPAEKRLLDDASTGDRQPTIPSKFLDGLQLLREMSSSSHASAWFTSVVIQRRQCSTLIQ